MANPKIIPPGRGQGRNIPKGYILGRTSTGRGPVELLDLRALQALGIASARQVNAIANEAGFSFNAGGTMADNEDLGAGVFPQTPVQFENGLPSSVVALVAPTSTATFNIYAIASGVPSLIGTITFAAGSLAGVVDFPVSYIFQAGVLIRLNAPTPADPTLASVSGTVAGIRG